MKASTLYGDFKGTISIDFYNGITDLNEFCQRNSNKRKKWCRRQKKGKTLDRGTKRYIYQLAKLMISTQYHQNSLKIPNHLLFISRKCYPKSIGKIMRMHYLCNF